MQVDFYPQEEAVLWTDGGERYMFPHRKTSLAGCDRAIPFGELNARKQWYADQKKDLMGACGPPLPDMRSDFRLHPDNFQGGSDAQASAARQGEASHAWAMMPESRLLHGVSDVRMRRERDRPVPATFSVGWETFSSPATTTAAGFSSPPGTSGTPTVVFSPPPSGGKRPIISSS